VAAFAAHLNVRVLASPFEEQVPWSLTVVEALNTGAAVINAAEIAKTNEQPSARAHSLTFIPQLPPTSDCLPGSALRRDDRQIMPEVDGPNERRPVLPSCKVGSTIVFGTATHCVADAAIVAFVAL